jgi:L-lactate dehydrogenase
VAGVRDVTVALPRIVGGQGIISTLWQRLIPEEQEALHKSAEIVKNAIESIHV